MPGKEMADPVNEWCLGLVLRDEVLEAVLSTHTNSQVSLDTRLEVHALEGKNIVGLLEDGQITPVNPCC